MIALRNWFVETIHLNSAPSGSALWEEFTEFYSDFYDQRKKAGFSRHEFAMTPVREYISAIRRWLKTHS